MAVEKNYSPWVDPNFPAGSVSAWVGLSDSTTNLFSQFGWLEKPGSVRHLFSQVSNAITGDVNTQYYYPTPAINSVSTVEVSWQPTNYYKFDYYENGSLVGGDSDSLAQFTPAIAQIAGEVYSLNDQMPGGYHTDNTTYQSWTSERVWYPATPGGNWHYFNENWNTAHAFDTNTAIYGYSNYPNPYLDSQYIWDVACPY